MNFNIIFAISLSISSLFSTFALALDLPYGTLPSEYIKIEDSDGAALYEKSNDFYVIYVDLDNSDIDFSNIESSGTTNSNGHEQFYRYDISEHWDIHADSNTFALVNGQFFDHITDDDVSPLTYPVVANYEEITDHVDDSTRGMMTLVKSNTGKYYIVKGYSSNLLNSNEEVYVGFDKDESLGTADKYGYMDRTYVGGIPKGSCNPDYATCEMDYLIFLIGNYESRSSMVSELNDLGVNDSAIIRLDGSDSSQFKTELNSFNDGKRKIPHTISISK